MTYVKFPYNLKQCEEIIEAFGVADNEGLCDEGMFWSIVEPMLAVFPELRTSYNWVSEIEEKFKELEQEE